MAKNKTSKAEIARKYIISHPNSSVAEVVSALKSKGVTAPTVYAARSTMKNGPPNGSKMAQKAHEQDSPEEIAALAYDLYEITGDDCEDALDICRHLLDAAGSFDSAMNALRLVATVLEYERE